MAQYTPQDLIDNLNYLNETKQLIKSSIINKGQEIDDNDTFRSYADKIDNIATDTTATENDITINKSAYINGNKVIGTYDINDTYKNILYNYIINAVKGETIHITDSANLPMILEPHGNVKQDTRIGYNKFNSEIETTTVCGVEISYDKLTGYIKLNGTVKTDVTGDKYDSTIFNVKNSGKILVQANIDYTLSIEKISGTYSTNSPLDTSSLIQLWDNSSGTWLYPYQLSFYNLKTSNSVNLTKSQTADITYNQIQLTLRDRDVFDNLVIGIQFEEGELKDFEQYGVMPSTEFPSKVKIVEGDNDILIEEGAEIIEPQSQNLSLTLPEGIKLYGKEDGFVYLTEEQATELELNGEGWYVYNEWDEYVFTGNETIVVPATPVSEGVKCYKIVLPKTFSNNYVKAACNRCSFLTDSSEWLSASNKTDIAVFSVAAEGPSMYWRVPEGEFPNVSAMSNYLKENETVIIFPVANPAYTKIVDSTLISQLESLKKVFSHYPVTNIDSVSENENAPIYFNVTYFKIK